MTAISLPFRFDGRGGVATTTSASEQALDRLASLIDTSPGERVMRPGYGTTARALVFETNAPFLAGQLGESIRKAVLAYDPDIQIHNVELVGNTINEDGTAAIEVDYSIIESDGVRVRYSATIGVGGSLIEEAYVG